MKSLYSKHPILTITLQCLLISIVVVLLSCSLGSFLHKYVSMHPYYNDPATFVVMGKSMVEGKTPYLEIFDHKGLYIFYETVLYAFMGRFGIFLTMTLFITVSLVFLVLTLKELGLGHRTTYVGLLFFTAIYVFFAQFPGDADLIVMTGMIMFYFYFKGRKNDNPTYYMIACILAGVSAGIALNIRPSDAMLGFAFMVFYIVKRIKEKKWTILLRDAGLCLVALVLTALPAYIHALSGHFLKEMVDAVFLSNLKYLGSATDKSVVLVWVSRGIVLAIFVVLFLLWVFKRKEYTFEESLFLLVNGGIIFVLQFVIALFAHYLISVLGFIVIALMIEMGKYKLLEEGKKSAKSLTGFAIFTFVVSLLFNPCLCIPSYFQEKTDIAYLKDNINSTERAEHTFLFNVSPSFYLNAEVGVIYPDFNAQTYHMKLSDTFTFDRMAEFVRSETCHYVVTKIGEPYYTIVRDLIGDADYTMLKDQGKISLRSITIFKHNV